MGDPPNVTIQLPNVTIELPKITKELPNVTIEPPNATIEVIHTFLSSLVQLYGDQAYTQNHRPSE